MNQYYANQGIINEKQQKALLTKRILLIGAGGLGGHLANGFVRLGLKELIIVDPDVYEITNLNRQLFSDHFALNKAKVEVLKKALQPINPEVTITVYQSKIETLDSDLFKHVDLIVDGVDTPKVKQTLEMLGETLNVPLLHGAIGGWYGQYGIVLPGSALLQTFYQTIPSGLEKTLRCPTFTLGVIANYMLSEYVKWIIHHPNTLIDQIMWVDLENNEQHILIDKTGDPNGES